MHEWIAPRARAKIAPAGPPDETSQEDGRFEERPAPSSRSRIIEDAKARGDHAAYMAKGQRSGAWQCLIVSMFFACLIPVPFIGVFAFIACFFVFAPLAFWQWLGSRVHAREAATYRSVID